MTNASNLVIRLAQLPVPLLGLAGLAIGLILAWIGTMTSPVLGLIAMVGVFGVLALVRYPVLGLYATALLVPMERLGRFTDDSTEFTISLMRIVGVVALGAMLLNRMLTRQTIHFGTPFWLYAGYAFLGTMTLAYTDDPTSTIRSASTILGNLLFFFLVVNLTRSPRDAIIAIVLWLAATLGTILYTTYDWHLGSGASGGVQTEFDPGHGRQTSENRFSTVWEDRAEWESLEGKSLRRTMGPTSHAAVYGINLIMTVPFFLLALRLPLSRLMKAGVIVTMALLFYNVLLTNTRAVILLAALTGMICIVRGLFVLKRGHLILALLLTPAVLVVVPQDVYNRILDMSNYTFEQSASLRIRMTYLDAGVRVVGDHFLTGVGLGNNKVIPEYIRGWSNAPKETTVHNEYLQTLIEVGLLGWLLFFAFVVVLLRMAMRAARICRGRPDLSQEYWFMIACQICMISVLIFGVQVDVFHFPLKGWWLVAGITYVMYRSLIEQARLPVAGAPQEATQILVPVSQEKDR